MMTREVCDAKAEESSAFRTEIARVVAEELRMFNLTSMPEDTPPPMLVDLDLERLCCQIAFHHAPDFFTPELCWSRLHQQLAKYAEICRETSPPTPPSVETFVAVMERMGWPVRGMSESLHETFVLSMVKGHWGPDIAFHKLYALATRRDLTRAAAKLASLAGCPHASLDEVGSAVRAVIECAKIHHAAAKGAAL